MSSNQTGHGDVRSISLGPEVHSGDGPPITGVAEQAERKQLPTNSMESGSSTLQLLSNHPRFH